MKSDISTSGWYAKLCAASSWMRMRKIVPIYAIDFDTAKSHGIVDSENKIQSNNINKEIDDDYMVCRDEDFNIWTEKKKSFSKRYKKGKSKQGIWHIYNPTKKAINLARPRVDSDIVDMKSINSKNSWQITRKELAQHYVTAHATRYNRLSK